MVLISRENRRKVYEYLLNEGVLVLKKVLLFKKKNFLTPKFFFLGF